METSFNWKSFVYNINSRNIVPVIGNDLSFVKLDKQQLSASDNFNNIKKSGTEDGDFIIINLYKYLAFRLWDIFEKGSITCPANINSVALHLYEMGTPENDIDLAIKNEISGLTTDQILLEPYLKLIKINGFESFVSVNFDNFLERAFEEAGKQVNRSFNFSIPLPSIDPNFKPDPALPRIYNLMGNIEGYNFATTDEQSLEYLYLIQNGMDTIAKELFDTIARKNILLVGSSFPDWFMRFFIRIISKERFKNGVKAKYVACDHTFQDPELKYFLENNATKVIPINNSDAQADSDGKIYKSSIDFINQMYEQCMESSEAKKSNVHYKEVVFISYSWTDKPLADRVKNEFEKHGLNVFFDDDELKTGDRYNQVIKNYLKDCNFFLALISNNAISDKNRYVYDKEWRSAIVLDGFKDQSYIRPFIIDDTPPTDDRIPEEFRNLNITKIDNFDELDKVVRDFIRDNNLVPVN
jgi:hypothetical protein